MKLDAWLKQAKLTNEQFALRIGVHPISVSKYRSGTTIPRTKVMEAIVDATAGDVRANDFFGSAPEQVFSQVATA